MRASTKDMNIENIDGSTFMMIITTGFYMATVILDALPLLRSIAAICAIAAGISTFVYNVYRMYKEYKQNKKE